jgi:hypothetical protein
LRDDHCRRNFAAIAGMVTLNLAMPVQCGYISAQIMTKGAAMSRLAPFALLLVIAACTPGAETPPDGGFDPTPDPRPDACGAAALQNLIGQPLAAFTGAPAAQAVRVIGPGMAVTMDYREDRMNVEHDAQRIIRAVYCG